MVAPSHKAAKATRVDSETFAPPRQKPHHREHRSTAPACLFVSERQPPLSGAETARSSVAPSDTAPSPLHIAAPATKQLLPHRHRLRDINQPNDAPIRLHRDSYANQPLHWARYRCANLNHKQGESATAPSSSVHCWCKQASRTHMRTSSSITQGGPRHPPVPICTCLGVHAVASSMCVEAASERFFRMRLFGHRRLETPAGLQGAVNLMSDASRALLTLFCLQTLPSHSSTTLFCFAPGL